MPLYNFRKPRLLPLSSARQWKWSWCCWVLFATAIVYLQNAACVNAEQQHWMRARRKCLSHYTHSYNLHRPRRRRQETAARWEELCTYLHSIDAISHIHEKMHLIVDVHMCWCEECDLITIFMQKTNLHFSTFPMRRTLATDPEFYCTLNAQIAEILRSLRYSHCRVYHDYIRYIFLRGCGCAGWSGIYGILSATTNFSCSMEKISIWQLVSAWRSAKRIIVSDNLSAMNGERLGVSEWMWVCVLMKSPMHFSHGDTLYIDFGEEINPAKWYFIWFIQLHSRALALTKQIESHFFFFSVCSRTCSLCMQFIYANKFNIALRRRCGKRTAQFYCGHVAGV